MSCVSAAVVSRSLFSIWLVVQREACTRDNGADGRWRFVSGIWKPFSLMAGGSTVMPGWTPENTPGSGFQLCQPVSPLVGWCAGDLAESKHHRANSQECQEVITFPSIISFLSVLWCTLHLTNGITLITVHKYECSELGKHRGLHNKASVIVEDVSLCVWF